MTARFSVAQKSPLLFAIVDTASNWTQLPANLIAGIVLIPLWRALLQYNGVAAEALKAATQTRLEERDENRQKEE